MKANKGAAGIDGESLEKFETNLKWKVDAIFVRWVIINFSSFVFASLPLCYMCFSRDKVSG